ncbi:hypothetical protein [Streptomyces sp. KLOTTS4A1]|uniref:hypothetical protein n=1 Tax=Streptomyces sp. KLOTTS4A1 TaxID=3390996 RepID=UPI0039F55509
MSSGIPDAHQYARRKRLQATARMRAHRMELALDRARTRAAQALSPDPDSVAVHRRSFASARRKLAELDAQGRVFTRRDTGARTVLRDTLGPQPGRRPARTDRYEVECLTHRSDPLYFDDFTAAGHAARHSDTWCEACRQLAATHTMRARARKALAPSRSEVRYLPPTETARLRLDPPAA